MTTPTRATAATALALALLLGACSSETSGPSGSTGSLSSAQADALGSDIAEDVADLVDVSSFDASSGIELAAPAAGTRAYAMQPPPACVTLSPLPVVNSDADPVPDSLAFSYADCVAVRANGNLIDSLSGIIDFIDPLPTQASLGVRHRFHDFVRSRTNVPFPARSWRAVHNGLREWGGSADTLGHTITGFTTERTFPNGRVRTHTRDWTSKFTATTPGSIALGQALPAGSWTMGGTGSWTAGGRAWSVVTSTVTPLAYDPSCTLEPRFTAGELSLVVTRNGEVSNVTITFTGCGAVTVAIVPATT